MHHRSVPTAGDVLFAVLLVACLVALAAYGEPVANALWRMILGG